MSDEKPKLELVETVEPVLTEEQKKAQTEFEEESKNFDMDERAAYLLEHEYPKKVMNTLKDMCKNKPNAVARVIYNEFFHPFHSVDLLSKEEKQLSKLLNEVLMAKRQIFEYTEKRKQNKEDVKE